MKESTPTKPKSPDKAQAENSVDLTEPKTLSNAESKRPEKSEVKLDKPGQSTKPMSELRDLVKLEQMQDNPAQPIEPKRVEVKEEKTDIINHQDRMVRVQYQTKSKRELASFVVPAGGCKHGEYPPELLESLHFQDLAAPQNNTLSLRTRRE